MAETEDLKSFQYRFESDWGHISQPFLKLYAHPEVEILWLCRILGTVRRAFLRTYIRRN